MARKTNIEISDKNEELSRLRYFQREMNESNYKSKRNDFAYFYDPKIVASSALLVLLCNLLWITIRFINGSIFNSPANTMAFITMSVVSVASLFTAIYNFSLKGKENKAKVVILFIFYVLLIVGTTCLSFSTNKRLYDEFQALGVDIPQAIRINLSSCLLILIAISPLPNIALNIIISVLMLTTAIIPGLPFVLGYETYSIISNLVLMVAIIVGIFFFYFKLKKESNLKIEFEYIAYSDHLTNTLNKRALDTCWDCLKDNQNIKSLGVIMYDIDEFKLYNDTYSHPEGDKVLIQVSKAVYESINDEKDFLFRYGGEEFIVLLPNATEDELINRATSMRYNIIQKNIERNDGGKFPYITVTLGCALVTPDIDYISLVDKQLYVGKKGAKNCVVLNGKIVVK